MGEKGASGNGMNQNVMLFGGLGLILVIFGVLEFLVREMPFRGSGIGTIALIVGVVLLLFAYTRMNSKPTK